MVPLVFAAVIVDVAMTPVYRRSALDNDVCFQNSILRHVQGECFIKIFRQSVIAKPFKAISGSYRRVFMYALKAQGLFSKMASKQVLYALSYEVVPHIMLSGRNKSDFLHVHFFRALISLFNDGIFSQMRHDIRSKPSWEYDFVAYQSSQSS